MNAQSPKTLLLVYHSNTGATEQAIHALARGAAGEPGVRVDLRHALAADTRVVLDAAGYVFATPECLASMAGLMKDFFDRTYYGALEQVQGRPYATLICAGSDGAGAARQIARIATGWRLREVAPALILCTGAQTTEAILAPKTLARAELLRCEELGAAFAAGLGMGVF